MSRNSGRLIAAALCLAIAVMVSSALTSPATAQESTSYRMDRVTVAAGASRAVSPSYEISLTFGEEGPAGSASRCNDGFLQTTGFWSVLGETPVPIRLDVQHAGGNPEDVELAWSGASSFFDVYRGEMGDSVQAAPNLTATLSDCSTSDSPPVIPGIIYYLVVPAGN